MVTQFAEPHVLLVALSVHASEPKPMARVSPARSRIEPPPSPQLACRLVAPEAVGFHAVPTKSLPASWQARQLALMRLEA